MTIPSLRFCGSAALVVAHLFLLSRLCAALPPIGPPTPTPVPAAYLSACFLYYDTAGKAGLVYVNSYPTSSTPSIYIMVPDRIEPFLLERTCTTFAPFDPKYSGSTFDFVARFPGVGDYRGTGIFDQDFGRPAYDNYNPPYYYHPPYYVIPTDSQHVGQELKLESDGLNGPPPANGQCAGISVKPFVSDGGSPPSYAATILGSDATDIPLDLTVKFSPSGNSTDTITLRKVLWTRHNDYDYSSVGVSWCGADYERPDRWTLGQEVPKGLVTVCCHADGYATDTVTLTMENETIYTWRPLLRPLHVGGSTFAPTGLSFGPVDWECLTARVEATDQGILFPAPASDSNGDHKVDVADIVYLLRRGDCP